VGGEWELGRGRGRLRMVGSRNRASEREWEGKGRYRFVEGGRREMSYICRIFSKNSFSVLRKSFSDFP
jgi:hypothetical protein